MAEDLMLETGDLLPHFEVVNADGSRIRYRDLWQRKNLLLVSLPETESVDSMTFVSQLSALMADLTAHDTACVITTGRIGDEPQPVVIIADRWSEIHFVAHGTSAADLPTPAALIDWLRYIQYRCPECEGEAR